MKRTCKSLFRRFLISGGVQAFTGRSTVRTISLEMPVRAASITLPGSLPLVWLNGREAAESVASVGPAVCLNSLSSFSIRVVKSRRVKIQFNPQKLLQNVFQLIILGSSVLFNILKVYKNRSPEKSVFF